MIVKFLSDNGISNDADENYLATQSRAAWIGKRREKVNRASLKLITAEAVGRVSVAPSSPISPTAARLSHRPQTTGPREVTRHPILFHYIIGQKVPLRVVIRYSEVN
jgi:hypothetical protein